MHYHEALGSVNVLLCNYSWNFEYTKAAIYTVENVGGNGQDPTTEMTHLGLNQPPVFSSVHLAAVLHRKKPHCVHTTVCTSLMVL